MVFPLKKSTSLAALAIPLPTIVPTRLAKKAPAAKIFPNPDRLMFSSSVAKGSIQSHFPRRLISVPQSVRVEGFRKSHSLHLDDPFQQRQVVRRLIQGVVYQLADFFSIERLDWKLGLVGLREKLGIGQCRLVGSDQGLQASRRDSRRGNRETLQGRGRGDDQGNQFLALGGHDVGSQGHVG